jgi:hypothetical protein
VLQYKQEFQNMNHEKPLLYHVFQLKFGQVYSVYTVRIPRSRDIEKQTETKTLTLKKIKYSLKQLEWINGLNRKQE